MEEIKKEPVTVLLILINTLIFLVVEFTGGSENGQHMLECGAAYAPLILEQLPRGVSICRGCKQYPHAGDLSGDSHPFLL